MGSRALGSIKINGKSRCSNSLERQVRYDLTVNDIKICDYIADFRYLLEEENGLSKLIVEDAKGVLTSEFKLKKKLMKAVHNIDIYLSFKKK